MDASWLLGGFLPLASWAGSGAVVVSAWLLTYAVHSTALLLAAWGVTSMRALRWSPAARLTIWRVALVAGVLTSAAQVAAPVLSRGRVLHLTESARASVAAVQVLQRATPSREFGEQARRSPAEPADAPPTAFDGTAIRVLVFTISRAAIAVAAWGFVAVILVARMSRQRRRLMSSLADRRAAPGSLAARALQHLATRAGVRRQVALSTSEALPAPAAISSHEIVLPLRALRDLSLAEQEGVLAHELAHVVRRDTGWLQLAAWIERLAWFQPLNRVARRQMQLHAEFAADAWAVQLTRQPLALARALASVAGWVAAHPLDDRYGAPGSAMTAGADGSPLVERVRRLTAPPRTTAHSPRLGGRWGVAVMTGAASLALTFLPRIDAGDATPHGDVLRREEHVELRLAGVPHRMSAPLRERQARWTGTQLRIVRVGSTSMRLVPAPGLPTGTHRVLVIARQVS